MIDNELGKKFKLNDIEKFLVDCVDDLDDKLEVETDENRRKELSKEKEVVNKLRDKYYNMKKVEMKNDEEYMEDGKRFEVIADYKDYDEFYGGSVSNGVTLGTFDDFDDAIKCMDDERNDSESSYSNFQIVDHNQE